MNTYEYTIWFSKNVKNFHLNLFYKEFKNPPIKHLANNIRC